jgi:hypothetical protein
MCHEDEHPEPAFGYLSMLESPEHGFFGGFLIISDWGRPLEFHCTAPVRPSRAQQILYGPSLRPYLLGDQIGPALLEKAQLPPQIILTDQAAGLFLRSCGTIPIAMVVGPADATDSVASNAGQPATGVSQWRSSSAALPTSPISSSGPLQTGGYELELAQRSCADRQRVRELLVQLAVHVDLAEPFERIHEAIREAQRIGERGPDVHGQAA